MAVNLQAFSRLSTRVDNTVVQAGSLEVPVNFSISGLKHDSIFSIANSASATVYTNADLSDFEYLWLASDQDVRVKIGDTNSNTGSFHIRGTGVTNRYGVPFILTYNHTTDASNTVNSIIVFNNSGSTAKVRIVAID